MNQVSAGMSGVITIGNPDQYLGDREGSYGLHGVKCPACAAEGHRSGAGQHSGYAGGPGLLRCGFRRRASWLLCRREELILTAALWTTRAASGSSRSAARFSCRQRSAAVARSGVWSAAQGAEAIRSRYGMMIRANFFRSRFFRLDGVAIDSTSTKTNDFASKAGNRFVQAACGSDRTRLSHPVCATVVRMMPSARTEIFIPSHLGQTKHATFITQALQTGLSERLAIGRSGEADIGRKRCGRPRDARGSSGRARNIEQPVFWAVRRRSPCRE